MSGARCGAVVVLCGSFRLHAEFTLASDRRRAMKVLIDFDA
jgi:hypothetical protein